MSAFFNNLIYYLQLIINSLQSLFINYNYNSKKEPSVSEETLEKYNKQRYGGPKKILCYAPYKHVYFKSNGSVTPCCRNDTDLYGNISEHSITELWNSNGIQQLRSKIEDYNLSSGCNFCNTQLESANFNAFEGRLYDSYFSPTKKIKYPTEITFEISNLCNLECIMCDGHYSSSIRKNREQLPELENKYGPEFSTMVNEVIPYLKVVRFLGGEPFLISQYIEIIESIMQKNNSCKIFIQTNGSVLNNRVKKIIEHKNVHLSISIDSLENKLYEKIRKNSSYSRLMEHMEYFILRSKKFNQIININFCVMTNNWHEVPNLIDYCNTNKFSLTLIPVEFPRYLSLRALNDSELKKIVAFYISVDLKIKSGNKFNNDKFGDLIQYLNYCRIQLKNNTDWKNSTLDSDLTSIKQSISKLLEKIALNNLVIHQLFDVVEQYSVSLTETDKKMLYYTLLNDLKLYPNETPIYHYKENDEWIVHLKEYVKNLILCIDKRIYH